MSDHLELTADEMRIMGYRVIDLIIDHFSNIHHKRVGAKAKPEDLLPLLIDQLPEKSRTFEEILARLEKDVFPNCLNLIHPRFFAFIPGPSNFVSVLADALASGINVFNGSWLGGSGAAAVEITVINWLRELCGFPEGAGGILVSGGSMANVTALVAARHAKLADITAGAVVYFSDQTHSSVHRALHVIGFSPGQIRVVASDDRFRISVRKLERLVRDDLAAGLRPFCIVANAGTTSTGAVDPLPELSNFCRSHDMWMHVDGAYGAAAVLTDQGRASLKGIEEADSLTLDPHKWLFQTIECGCVLVRNAELLKTAFMTSAEYLSEIHRSASEFNPCDYGVQLTRSFRALKVWMSFQFFGLAEFRRAIERGLSLATFAEDKVRAMAAWEIVTPAQLGIVTFCRRGANEHYYHALHEAMLEDSFAFLSTTVLGGRAVLRLCTINPRTTEADVVRTLDWLDTLVPAN